MKNKTLLFLSALLAFTACESDINEVEPVREPDPETLTYDEVPNWEVIPSDTYDNSMMLIVSGKDLPAEPSASDKMAAFIGSSCRGLTEGVSTLNDQVYYMFSVKGSIADKGGESVVLKYYSGQEHHIFTADAFPFEDNGMLGTLDEPYVPKWSK